MKPYRARRANLSDCTTCGGNLYYTIQVVDFTGTDSILKYCNACAQALEDAEVPESAEVVEHMASQDRYFEQARSFWYTFVLVLIFGLALVGTILKLVQP